MARSYRGGAFCLVLSALLITPGMAQMPIEDAKNRAAQLCNESVPLIGAARYEAAEAKLTESIKLDPDNASTLSNYGLTLLKLGRLAEARKQLEKSVALDPKSDASVLNLGLSCEGMGDLVAAKTYLLKFIDLSHDKDMLEKMKDHLAIIDKTLAGGVASADGADYFAQIKRSQMFPWPKELMPIKIYIAAGDDVPGYRPSYGEDLEAAISTWSKVLDGIVSFQRTNKHEEANIEVHWAHDFKTALMKAEGGDCKYVANGAGMKHADITVLTVDPSASDKLNDAKVSWVALHEFGHALGINGHSNNPIDVMYFAAPLKNAMPKLSSRDTATFTRLYTEKLADTWLTLNEDAIKLMRAKKYAAAIEKLEQALKLNPDQKVLKENLVLAEESFSSELIEANNYKEAESHLLRALDSGKGLQNENLDVLLNNYALLLKRTGRGEEVKAMYKRYGKVSGS